MATTKKVKLDYKQFAPKASMAKVDPKAPVTNETFIMGIGEGLTYLFERVEETIEEKLAPVRQDIHEISGKLRAGNSRLIV